MNKVKEQFVIPSGIQLMCRPIDVVFEGDLVNKQDIRGGARYRTNQIVIQEDIPRAVSMPYDHQVETYFHEVGPWIFNLLEREDLNEDEKLIEQMGKLLAQAALTARYE